VSEAVGVDTGAVESVVDVLSGVAGRLPGLVPVRSYPTLPASGVRVVDAGWRFDDAIGGAVDGARMQCRVAIVTLRVLVSDVSAADRWSGPG